MIEQINRKRVNGYLQAKGTKIVNGQGEEIILTGWGLGNWLLCEGYMWMSYKSKRFDRPHRIEQVIRELTGSKYSEYFWKQFRENYITKEDIKAMADLGYNSVRIPFNWRIFMEDEEEIIWKEDGFTLLDRCIDWCEEYRIYAFLDLHGAPGGQTGANIDDSVDDIPRLFIDADKWDKCIKLWEKLALRYRDRWIVGGYDLLNEPIRPEANGTNFDYLLPKLGQFYEEAIAAIRRVDKKHMLSIEGHHWSTDTSVFHKRYDDNMVIHFHRYGCMPDISAYEEYLELSKRLQQPLWLGETGENVMEWFTAMYPLAVSCGIGHNLWPWKKMARTNSPCAIRKPQNWEKIIGYAEGGPHPGYQEARKILDEFLNNIKYANCEHHPEVTNAVFRTPGCRVRATDFEHFPGKGISYSGIRSENNFCRYRRNTGMKIIELYDIRQRERKFAFDSMWDRFALELMNGEFAEYAIYNVKDNATVSLELHCEGEAEIILYQENKEIGRVIVKKTNGLFATDPMNLMPADSTRIRVEVRSGKIIMETICFKA